MRQRTLGIGVILAVIFWVVFNTWMVYAIQQELKSAQQVISEQAESIMTLEQSNKLLRTEIVRIQKERDASIQQLKYELYQQKQKPVSRGTEREKTVTAYTYTGNNTAQGTPPVVGRTCAAARDIPFGTVLYIEGIGERIVEDRTAKKYDGRVDVFMETEQQCLDWGIQQRTVQYP